MKLILTENQLKSVILFETIRAEEASNDIKSIMSVIDGKRGICTIHLNGPQIDEFKHYIRNFNLSTMVIPSNPYDYYVVYANGYHDRAKELVSIAEKYNGFLSDKATKEDTMKIGSLLEYDPQDIEDFIKKHYTKNGIS